MGFFDPTSSDPPPSKYTPLPLIYRRMEGIIGEVILFAKSALPIEEWVECNGSTMHIKDSQALASVLGYDYNDIEGTYTLPDIPSPHPQLAYIMCVEGVYPIRRSKDYETH